MSAAARAVRLAAWSSWALAAHAALNALLLRRPPASPPGHAGGVSVLVPVRDEAARVAPCIRSLLGSRGVDDLEVLVLDDGSTDGTADVVAAAAAGDPRVRVLTGRPLPDGWLGKPHACAQLAEAASGDVLVFVDADVRVAPDGVASAAALLGAHDLDLVSPYPRQEADGWLPRLIQPLLSWSWLSFVPLRLAERSARPALAVAGGQLLACRAAAYRAVGGHGAVRDAVIEDVELARAMVRAGHLVALADGAALAACRMYDGPADLAAGYTKSLWAAFGSRAGAASAACLLALLYLLPPAAAAVAVARGRPRAALPGLAGYAAGAAGRVVAARRTGGRAADAFAHPVSVGALLWLLASSWVRRSRGTLSWKGRPVARSRGRPPRAEGVPAAWPGSS